MAEIKNLQDIWDNGAVALASLSGDEIDEFKQRTNAIKVVARKWMCEGKMYQTPYQVRLLPDQFGLVQYKNGDPRTKSLVVLNGDGTQRVVIDVPRVDSNSRPENGYLALPPSSASFGGIEWGCEGNDGHTDYLFEFDWQTGSLLRYARPTRPW